MSPYSPLGYVSGGFAGIAETNQFDSRLQPALVSASTAGQTLLSLNYNFGIGVNDNGNVYGITNNKSAARSQTFTYDSADRLQSARTASTWGLSFSIDAWGNMYQTSGIQGTSSNPQPLNTSANLNNTLVGFSYDAAGNLTQDGSSSSCTGAVAYAWNAESQMSCAEGVLYTYDGDGGRVKKSSGTLYWGGEAGAALAESDLSGNITSEYIFVNGKRIARKDTGGSVYYYLSDHLGSSSVVTNATGTIENESDYYPYGGESAITQNLSSQHYKFTGKERDSESGNNYFGARYFTSNVGRFLSPDWSAKVEPVPYSKLGDPQTLNLYAYVANNPETFADPDGHQDGGGPINRDGGSSVPTLPSPSTTDAGCGMVGQTPCADTTTTSTAQQQESTSRRGLTVGVGVSGNADVGVVGAGAEVNGTAVVTASVSSKGHPSVGAAASGGAVAYAGKHTKAAPNQAVPPLVMGCPSPKFHPEAN